MKTKIIFSFFLFLLIVGFSCANNSNLAEYEISVDKPTADKYLLLGKTGVSTIATNRTSTVNQAYENISIQFVGYKDEVEVGTWLYDIPEKLCPSTQIKIEFSVDGIVDDIRIGQIYGQPVACN